MQGKGTILKVDSASSGSFTTITKRMKLELPEQSREDVEITDLDSTADEFEAGTIRNSGELSGTIYTKLSEASHETMIALLEAGTKCPWQVQFPGHAYAWQFTAYVQKFKPGSAEKNKNYEGEFTLKISGTINRVATPA